MLGVKNMHSWSPSMYVLRVKNMHSWSPSILKTLGSIRWGEAKFYTSQHQGRRSQAMQTSTSLIVSSPPLCRSQSVLCVSTPRMYPRSGYFLCLLNLQEHKIFLYPSCKRSINDPVRENKDFAVTLIGIRWNQVFEIHF